MANRKIRMRPEGANDYGDVLHPETTASQVIQETNLRFITDAERVNWNGKLNSNAQAVDSAKLGGQLPSYYAKASELSSFSWELLRTITSVASGTREISIPISGEYSSFMINTTNLSIKVGASSIDAIGAILYDFKVGSTSITFKGYNKAYKTSTSSAPDYIRFSTASFPYMISRAFTNIRFSQTLNLTSVDTSCIVSGLTSSTTANLSLDEDFIEAFGASITKPVGYISEITISLVGHSSVSFSSTSSTSIKVWGRK